MRASRRNSPEIVGRKFHTDRAFAVSSEPAGMRFVTGGGGRAFRFAKQNRDHQDIGRATWFVGGSDDQRVADMIDEFPPLFQTWRRRIAEQFVHQEGVSL
ncbi:DUF1702 family protein [Actinosynnema sp. NPDC051121]